MGDHAHRGEVVGARQRREPVGVVEMAVGKDQVGQPVEGDPEPPGVEEQQVGIPGVEQHAQAAVLQQGGKARLAAHVRPLGGNVVVDQNGQLHG